MRVPSWLLPAEVLLLLGGLQLIPFARAGSSVRIGLKASFDAAPYLVELLETAAEENETVYFKILDRIAEGHFSSASSDRDLYEKFVELLQREELFQDSESLSSFNLALSVRNAAPRIEAHYQYYKTSIEPLLAKSGAKNCETWLEFTGRQFCSPQLEKEDAKIQGLPAEGSSLLPFDREHAPTRALPAIIYADITSTEFGKFHPLIKQAADNGRVTYRVRHRPPIKKGEPLAMNGFGTHLDLKRTDYIVIDDRGKGDIKQAKKEGNANEVDEDEEVNDLTPLSSSELEVLGLKAAAYVLDSEFPLKRLFKVTQDFPKYSSVLAGTDVPAPLIREHEANREMLVPEGYNVMWINGLQYDSRKMDAFSLLDFIRRERRFIAQFKEMGLQTAEAIKLLTHPAMASSQRTSEVTRYDWRDETEGGGVIIWLNDIEKDKRYEDWPSLLMSYLSRTYPGQMPSVRRDAHNAVFPIDFSDPKGVAVVVEALLDFVKRKIPVRFGVVPISLSENASQAAQVAYHILENYGLGALMEYLTEALETKKINKPHEGTFKAVVEKRTPRHGLEALSLQQVLASDDMSKRLGKASAYLARLGGKGATPPIFINGVPIKNDDDWMQVFSQRITMDLRSIQRGIYEATIDDDVYLPSLFLNGSSLRRNALVIPEDEKSIKLLSLLGVHSEPSSETLSLLPTILASKDSEGLKSQLFVVGDFDTNQGLQLMLDAIDFRKEHDDVEVIFVNNGNTPVTRSSKIIEAWPQRDSDFDERILNVLYDAIKELLNASTDEKYNAKHYFPDAGLVIEALGFQHTESGLNFNGRKVGPIPANESFIKEDFTTLYDFESKTRGEPAREAIDEVGVANKLQRTADSAKLVSLLSLSTVSDMPEGIFELPPPIRTRLFYEWNSTYTAIHTGDNTTASINIVASIDPASETAQRWTPILKVLSELEGTSLRLFLNPRTMLEELPIKRFYRYALDGKPAFDDTGSVSAPGVSFENVPKDALLTTAMDVPPNWLVAPKDSVHDLDNIKLSSLPVGTDVEAIYELESILIEGHSRDANVGIPPRGAQLALSTAKDEQFADTIIMANLGYFQFKANPGYYNISLLPGPSQRIFSIDSVGALGYDPVPGDETTEVTLMSFQGVTLYPRLSRKPGMEEEDVLGMPKPNAASAVEGLIHKGAEAVDGLLSRVGIKNPKAGEYVSKALAVLDLPADLPAGHNASAHADINIFSVASGHLYERMLNIMMLSVMKHTNHTVKFWFIEQFLSPSFKDFLPSMAAEYGFKYELVTYKWPHWLRSQTEKQREIWGYKILFLDVLFPLDLDKVIFVDADQIVRTDMIELVRHDLQGAPYGFTPMCDSRTEMEGFRFWKQGYWKNFLRGLPYHISALYVVDLHMFRSIAAGDRLRQQYHQLSADPNSLSNLDQDLPNNMQHVLPIHSLPQEWLWCETWCSDESLEKAKTIDLCNNPQTKEPKLERARRQVPEWREYDEEIAGLARRVKGGGDVGGEGSVQEAEQLRERELQREKEEKEKETVKAEEKGSVEHNEL